MAVLWQQERGGTRYSVRAHGESVRLYTNGVFHSQWNPARPFAGGVWDCLSLPALYRAPETLARALVLGAGGGAALRQLETLAPALALTAIEIDPVHLEVARRWFGVDPARVALVEADAERWLRDATETPFDLLVDDLFGHADGEPERARPLTPEWVGLLAERLAPGGLLVVNCIDVDELDAAVDTVVEAGLGHASRWSLDAYDNAIGVFSDAPLVPREWSRRLDAGTLDARSRRQARRIARRPLRARGARRGRRHGVGSGD